VTRWHVEGAKAAMNSRAGRNERRKKALRALVWAIMFATE